MDITVQRCSDEVKQRHILCKQRFGKIFGLVGSKYTKYSVCRKCNSRTADMDTRLVVVRHALIYLLYA